VDAEGYNSTSQYVTVQNDTVTTNDVTLQSDSTTDDLTDDEDSTTDDGAIGVEIVVDEYRIVENQEVNLTAEISGATADEVSFEWFVSGESFGGDTQSIEYVFDDAGDYRLSVRVTEDATGDIVEGTLSINEEDATSDTIPINEESEYSDTLSINEEDWTEDEETGDREIIYTDLIVKTYNDAGNPINATVNVNWHYTQIGHTTEWQVNADRTANVLADDYTNCDCVARDAPRDSPGWEKFREKYTRNNEWKIDAKKNVNMSVAEGEPKTVELTLDNISVPSRKYSGDGDWIEAAYQNGTIWGSGGGGGDGGGAGGISASITLSILAAATLLIIIGVFWLFKLLAAVLGIDGGTNGLGRLLRGEDD
jgi:hypothetical protein